MRATIKAIKRTRRAPAPDATPTVPATMRAAVIDDFGGADVIRVRTLAVPELGANEVLIALHTAGVARWDADMRDGWNPTGRRPRLPIVLGTDGSGIIAAKGSRVRRFSIGDPVFAAGFLNPYGKGGFYAEFVALSASEVARAPRTLELRHAGAIPITGVTALQGIERALRVKKGERIFIHGASGGVGTLAVQLAKVHGAKVFATASGDDGVALVTRLGADSAVEGKSRDLVAAARAFAPEGFDAGLIFAPGAEPLLDLIRPRGRAAYPNGVEPAPKKRRGLKLIAYDGETNARELERLARIVDEARIDVPLGGEFPLDETARAHESLAGHVLGKIVLAIR